MLVVNGTSEFGSFLCEELAEYGSNLVIIGDNDKNKKKLSEVLSLKNISYELPQFDISSQDKINYHIKDIGKRLERLDGFVFILPEMSYDSLSSIKQQEWENMMNTLRVMFWYYRAVSKLMLNQKYGSIIGICFGINARGDEQLLTWSVAGDTMVGFSKCLALELLNQDIRVNSIGYGFIEKVEFPYYVESKIKEFSKFLGLTRQGTVKDIAALTGFLTSKHSSYITGQTLYVNGGLLI